jgi:hypothetical protein
VRVPIDVGSGVNQKLHNLQAVWLAPGRHVQRPFAVELLLVHKIGLAGLLEKFLDVLDIAVLDCGVQLLNLSLCHLLRREVKQL